VPEALARVTELLRRRALEEARERLKILRSPQSSASGTEELRAQVMKLSVALAEARAREQLTHLAVLSKDRETLRAERGKLLALLKSTQVLLEQQATRVSVRERRRITTPLPRAESRRNRRVKSKPRRLPSTKRTASNHKGAKQGKRK